MEVYNGFECYVCENKELEFVDVWTPKQHEKYVCSKCKTPYHILTEQEYEKYTKIWNEHNSCAYKLSQAQDKLHRRNMQIKELKKCYALAVKEQENLRDIIDDMKKERF